MSGNFYQEYKLFSNLYPFPKCDPIGEGGHGNVYKSGNFAIKEFIELGYFIDELLFGVKVNHPNILKLIAWSTNDNYYYICYPLGLDVETMYDKNKISLDDIISHTLSAVLYLSSMNMCHNDIWIKNLIYHNGSVKLIDFGCSGSDLYEESSDFYDVLEVFLELTSRPYCEKLQFLVDHYDDLDQVVLKNLKFLNVKHKKIQGKRLRDVKMFEISNKYNLTPMELQEVNLLFSRCIDMNMKREESLTNSCIWICCKPKRDLIKMDKSKILFILQTLE